jgi:UDP-glucose 4-epimerase
MIRRNIVLTGATGLLGSYLLPMLKAGNDVWAISQDPPENDLAEPVSWITYDLAGELSGLKELLPERIDAVIHLAQSPFFRDFPHQAQHIFNVNVNATMFLLDLASSSGCRHFVNASSGGVYSFSDSLLTEQDGVELLPAGSGFYPISKQCSELLVNAYATLMDIVNLRFFFIYGSGQSKDMLIPRLVESVRLGKDISIQGNEGLSLNPVHASDAAKAVMKSLDLNGSHTINVAGKNRVSLKQLGIMIGKTLNVEAKFSANLEQPVNDIVADISVMGKLLLEPETELTDGIAEYCMGSYES